MSEINYLEIVIHGYHEARRQTTLYVPYFKREAQVAKRDDFCEFVDFFNGCRQTVQYLKHNIERQLNDQRLKHKQDMELYRQGKVKAEDGHLITDKSEIDDYITRLKKQMAGFTLESFVVNNSGSIPHFSYSELKEIEQKIEQAEMELNNTKTENGTTLTQNNISGNNVIVNNGNVVGGQSITQEQGRGKDKRVQKSASYLIAFLTLVVGVIVGWDKIVDFFSRIYKIIFN
jgi:hypothetical protein